MDLDGTAPSRTLDEATESQVLAVFRQLTVEVIGAEYALGLEIEMDTSINEELELESVELVRLAGKLNEYYDGRANFVDFLFGKDVDELVGMTVGQVVRYIVGCLDSSKVTASHG